MVASLNAKGKMASVVPHGVLFRGGAEGKIREGFLKDDLIEAIIGLPKNIFYGTGIPAAIIVINKNKTQERKNKVLFIDGSNYFIKDGNKNRVREVDIDKIVKAFDEYIDVGNYANVVEIEVIKENDYNLNISRYVDTSEEEEEVDIDLVLQDIRELKLKMEDTEKNLNGYLAELGFNEI